MINIDLDPKTSKYVLIILLLAGLVFGSFWFSTKLHKVEVDILKQQIATQRIKDSLTRIIHIKEYELNELYTNIESIDKQIKERDEKTFEVIDSFRKLPDSIKYSEWANRYLNNKRNN